MEGLRILNNYVLVEMDEVPEKEGRFYLPESVKEKKERRLISGKVICCGKKVNPDIKVGQKCWLEYYAGEEFDIDGKFYKIVKDHRIVMVGE